MVRLIERRDDPSIAEGYLARAGLGERVRIERAGTDVIPHLRETLTWFLSMRRKGNTDTSLSCRLRSGGVVIVITCFGATGSRRIAHQIRSRLRTPYESSIATLLHPKLRAEVLSVGDGWVTP